MICGDPPFEEDQNGFSSCSNKCKQTTAILAPANLCLHVISSEKPSQDKQYEKILLHFLIHSFYNRANFHPATPRRQGPASVSANIKTHFFEIALVTKLFKQKCSVGAPFFLGAYILCWCNQNGNPMCLNMINIELYGGKKKC